jgi:8-oxo-dGTP diphosphatase
MSHGTTITESASLRVCVNVIIFSVRNNDLKVLLLPRSAAPQRGHWEIPGDSVGPAEGLDEAAHTEMHAQTDVTDVYMEQLYTFGAPRRDPRGRTISVAYLALVGADVKAGPVAGAAGDEAPLWQSVYGLPDMAFDHGEIVRYALQRLRYKLEYTSVGFELLPNEFTLSELQAAYEIVLGENLDKRNFRRRILAAAVLVETNQYRGGEGQGRPARLYRYKQNAVTQVKARRLFP